ncbi:MAG: YitT family protein [Streptococcaceae bacterium]|nr:YitT family protein [Streptococcaceae bacterium]
MMNLIKKNFVSLLIVALGTAVYAFGFVNFNMVNSLAEGGVAGISLIGHALLRIDPSLTTLLINIPLLFIGYRHLGRRTFVFTVWGIVSLSAWIWLFQRIPFTVSVGHDMLIGSLLAGVFAGFGIGIVFRVDGTTGGTDIVARLLQTKQGIPLSTTFVAVDSMVLVASLSYIDLKHMMYTLICSFVASQVLEFVQSGGYTVRGMLIISSKPEELAETIMKKLGRGVTFLNGEGAYSGDSKKVLYVILNPREIQEIKRTIQKVDENAFSSIINVHEVMGDFNYSKSNYAEKKARQK